MTKLKINLGTTRTVPRVWLGANWCGYIDVLCTGYLPNYRALYGSLKPSKAPIKRSLQFVVNELENEKVFRRKAKWFWLYGERCVMSSSLYLQASCFRKKFS